MSDRVDTDLIINAAYVLKKLEEHQAECSDRWWAVMKGLFANMFLLIIGMAGVIVTLVVR